MNSWHSLHKRFINAERPAALPLQNLNICNFCLLFPSLVKFFSMSSYSMVVLYASACGFKYKKQPRMLTPKIT